MMYRHAVFRNSTSTLLVRTCTLAGDAVCYLVFSLRCCGPTAKGDSAFCVFWRNLFLDVAQYEELSTCTSLLNHIRYVMSIDFRPF